MSDSQKQRWFMVSFESLPRTYYLCCCETHEDAEKSFELVRPRGKVVQLTWRELSELTGCLIPCQCKPKDYANDRLMFMRRGSFITIL